MFLERLKQLAARLMGGRRPPFGPPEDPFARVREPRKRGPDKRQSAVAVREPEPEQPAAAIGRSRPVFR